MAPWLYTRRSYLWCKLPSVTALTRSLRSAGLQQEAQALEANLPLVDRDAYASDATNRKRLHYESHRRRRGR
jgi:hypothetical protein